MRFEKCLKLQTNITFWYQLLISLRYKIEKLLCSEWLCFSNLALAKLVAVCVKAGKLLGWRVLTICTPHWAPHWGCPGSRPAPGRAGGWQRPSDGPGTSSRVQACCSLCGTCVRKTDTGRVSHLQRENIMNMWHHVSIMRRGLTSMYPHVPIPCGSII